MISALLCIICLTGGSAAQIEDDMAFLYQIDVFSALIDVIVTDAEGNYVTDLTADEFVIRVDGKEMKIESCELIIHDEEAAKERGISIPVQEKRKVRPKPPAREFFLFFDLYNTQVTRVAAIKQAAEKFITEVIDEKDHLLLAQLTSTGKIEILLPPSSTREEAVEELNKISGGSFYNVQLIEDELMNQMHDPDIDMGYTVGQITMQATEVFYRNRLTVNALNTFIDAIRHFPGRKNVIYFSEGIERRAGERFIYLVESLIKKKSNLAYIKSIGEQAQSSSDGGGGPTGDSMAGVAGLESTKLIHLRSRLRDMTQFLNSLIETSNVSQIVFYPVDLAGLLPSQDMFQMSEFGVWGGTAVLGHIRSNYEEVFRFLAGESGGRASLRSQDYDRILQDIYADTNIYYMLSYTPTNVKRDSVTHDVDIRVTRPGCQVRSRNKIRYRSMKDEVEARITSALLLPESFRHEGLKTNLDYFYQTDNLTGVTLSAGLPADECIFPQTDGTFSGKLDYHGIIFDSKGKIVRTFDNTGTMRLKEMPATLLSDIYCVMRKNLELTPGEYTMSVAFRSKESQEVSGYSEKLTIPAAAMEAPAISTIHLYGGPVEKIRWDVTAESAETLASDELSFRIPGLATPSLRNIFSSSDYLTAYVRILYPDGVTSDMREDRAVAFEIYREDGEGDSYPAKIKDYRIVASTNPKELIYVATIDVASLENGAYKLNAVYVGSRERVSREKTFYIRVIKP
jgi:VWFA-related protein